MGPLSEEFFAKVFHSSPDAIAIIRISDRRMIEANQTWLDLFGLIRDEAVNSIVDFSFLENEADQNKLDESLNQQKPLQDCFLWVRRKDGSLTNTSLSSFFFEEGVWHQVLTLRNLNDRIHQPYHAQEQASWKEKKGRDLSINQVIPENKLHALLESISSEVWYLELDGNQVLMNPASAVGLGLDSTEPIQIDALLSQVKAWNADGSQRAAQDAPLVRSLRGETLSVDEIVRHLKTGELRYRHARTSPVRDPDGRIIGAVGVVEDITEQKQNEEKLRENARILDLAPVLVRDLDSRIILWNSGAEKLYGYSAAEAVGQVSHDLLNTVFPIPLDQLMEQLFSRGSWEGELIHRRRDGIPVTLASLHVLYYDQSGKPTRILEVNHDISDLRAVERDRLEAEKKLEFIFNNMPVGISVLDANENILYSNPALSKIFQLSQNPQKGSYLKRRYLKPDRTPMQSDSFASARVLKEQKPVYDTEIGVILENGNEIWTNVSAFPVDLPDWKVVVVSADITPRKIAEEHLKKVVDELLRSNSELEQFAYVASHDLQEPLRGVSGMAQLLLQKYQGKLDETADEYIELMIEGTLRMQTMISDLLILSRVNRFGKTFSRVDTKTAVKRSLENLSASIHESDAKIVYEELPAVIGDITQITQVFQNLIGNAIKFRGERKPDIHVSAELQVDEWVFSVSDNGIGIEAQYFERIFLVFQRLHTQREYPGSGIGLSICKKIIERHGGRIWVESTPGLGSTFFFTIPERMTGYDRERI
jgi:PAS domain S-box-containing protein